MHNTGDCINSEKKHGISENIIVSSSPHHQSETHHASLIITFKIKTFPQIYHAFIEVSHRDVVMCSWTEHNPRNKRAHFSAFNINICLFMEPFSRRCNKNGDGSAKKLMTRWKKSFEKLKFKSFTTRKCTGKFHHRLEFQWMQQHLEDFKWENENHLKIYLFVWMRKFTLLLQWISFIWY